jgi:DNA-binding LacI/PurR family transcriptional regulator
VWLVPDGEIWMAHASQLKSESSRSPKYSKVTDFIKAQIRQGKYRVGEILPGQRVLSTLLSVSRPSVSRAIEALEKEGILECNPSIGSIVRKAPSDFLMIGYMVRDLQDPFHLELIQELDLLLHRLHGALIAIQGDDESRLSRMGITHAVKHHELYWSDRPDRIPTVYTGNVSAMANSVVSDVRSGMGQILEHLASLGHRRIAYASPFAESDDIMLRHLQEAAAVSRTEIPSRWRLRADPLDTASCAGVISAIRGEAGPPTALVCYNDWLAIAVMRAAKEQGLEVPRSLSITGYDDLFVSSLLQVPLTTVRFSRKETAEKILKVLLGPQSPDGSTEVVETRLIVRESTCPVP